MPKRSNQFQKLVFLVNQQIGTNSVVTESKMLVDRVSRKEVEVDVCITTKVNDVDVNIVIECTDSTRPANVEWVQQMRGKHEFLPSDKLILASRSGFTPKALERASTLGYLTLSLSEIGPDTVAHVLALPDRLISRKTSLEATQILMEVVLPNDSAQTVQVFPNQLVFTLHREVVGTVQDFLYSLLLSEAAAEQLRKGTAEDKSFNVNIDLVPYADSQLEYALQDDDSKELHRIRKIIASGDCDFSVSEYELKQAQLGKHPVAWGTIEIQSKHAFLVMSGTVVTVQVGNPGKEIGPPKSGRIGDR